MGKLNNPWFTVTYLLLLVIGFIELMATGKEGFILWLNGNYNSYLDVFFKLTNQFGEGGFYLTVLLVLLIIRPIYWLFCTSSLVVASIIVRVLKVLFDTPRPVVWFKGKEVLHFVDGVYINYQYSFPSGHTAAAFTVFCCLALLVADKRWGVMFCLMAAFGGLARIYLAQHFLIDVLFGSIIGVAVPMLFYPQFQHPTGWLAKPFFNQSLLKSIRK